MLVQGIVDANMRFLDVNIGWPGSCNDKRVLRNSGFYRLCQGCNRLAGPTFVHEDPSIQEYIVGDGGYVLLPWLVIPYPRAMLQSTSHRRYNFLHSSTRIVVERAFGRLKETWKFLGGTVRCPNLLTLPSTIQACCILHNMLMDLTDEQDPEVCQIDVNDPLLDNPLQLTWELKWMTPQRASRCERASASTWTRKA
ncbi:hypothetical protein L7F22_030488 [Adiantum nelumboides]|nr:hypothetical protein [Adiantum nelumboides]